MLVLLLLACTTPDPSPVLDVVAVASPMAWAADRAWSVASGVDDACIIERTPCAEAPCTGAFRAEVSEVCPLPFAPSARGEVDIGLLTTDDEALGMLASFVDVTVDGTPLLFSAVDGAILSVGDPGDDEPWRLAWLDLEVTSFHDTGSSILEGSWTLAADAAGTPDDRADDTYELAGAQQWIGAGDDGAHVRQTIASGIVFGGDCPLNPTAGSGGIQQVDNGDRMWIDEIVVQFVDRCDGTADVYSTTSGTPLSRADVYVTRGR